MPVLRTIERGIPRVWRVASRDRLTHREWYSQPFIREDAVALVRAFNADDCLGPTEVFWIEPIREEYKYRDKDA